MIYKYLFNFVKNKLPKISKTELIALQSGNTSIDRNIMQGIIKYPIPFLFNNKFPQKKNELFT